MWELHNLSFIFLPFLNQSIKATPMRIASSMKITSLGSLALERSLIPKVPTLLLVELTPTKSAFRVLGFGSSRSCQKFTCFCGNATIIVSPSRLSSHIGASKYLRILTSIVISLKPLAMCYGNARQHELVGQI